MPDSHPESERDEQLQTVIAEYIRSSEAGRQPVRQDLLNQYPEFATELTQFFAQRDQMNRLADPIRAFTDDLFQAVGPSRKLSYVGNYELLEEVARGGMGVVYKARQTTLGRIVAVKMIVSGRLATDDDIQRFQIEAQAAASLQHPNIVSIHEVGQHEGWHYFSMDYVEGRDLAKILRENLLPAKQAAAYVRQMADAIHYSHQQGTLHRDLKPSNVLIDSHDQIRITDFGLAMRIEGDSDLTRTGQIVGTPSYMPPEQAQGKRSVIGPGSDVYSLGAILYECLTGRPPFRADSVMKTIEQVIHLEAASPRLLNSGIPRDLETICLECLHKEPHRRYGTAQLLADDLGRYLRDEPILARPVSQLERVWRWTRRNPRIAALSAMVLMLIVSIAIGSSVGMLVIAEQKRQADIARCDEVIQRAEVERQKTLVEGQRDRAILAEQQAKAEEQRALNEEQRAKESEADTNAFSDFLVKDVLSAARPAGVQQGLGLNVTVAQALEAAEGKVTERFAGRPLAEAIARDALGKTFRNLSKYESAERHLRRSVELYEQELGPDDPATLDSQNSLGVTLNQMGRSGESLAIHEHVLERMKNVLGVDHQETLMSMSNLAEAYLNLGKFDQAVPLQEESVKKMTELLGDDHPETLRSTSNLARGYQAIGKVELAIPLLERTLEKRREIFGDDHPKSLSSMNNLASAYSACGRVDQAVSIWQETLRMSQLMNGPDHPDNIFSMNNLATAYLSLGRTAQALELHQQTLLVLKKTKGVSHPHTLGSTYNVAAAYRELGRFREAEPLFLDAADGARRTLGLSHPYTQSFLQGLAGCYVDLRQPQKAEPLWRELMAHWKENEGADSLKYANGLASLSLILFRLQKPAEAELLLRECLQIRESRHPNEWTSFYTMSLIGDCLLAQQQYADAEPLLLRGFEGLETLLAKLPPRDRVRRTEAIERLVKLYEAWGKPDVAAPWRAKLTE